MQRWFGRALIAAALLSLQASGCGYSAVYGGARPEQRLAIVVGSPKTPDLGAAEAAVSGARAELSEAGVLASGTAFPRLEVELLRVDELSAGISEAPTGTTPIARGSAVAVVAQGRVFEQPGIVAQDSGTIRRVEWVASGPNARSDARTYDAAIRAAARRAGRAIARRVLGVPEPANEAL